MTARNKYLMNPQGSKYATAYVPQMPCVHATTSQARRWLRHCLNGSTATIAVYFLSSWKGKIVSK